MEEGYAKFIDLLKEFRTNIPLVDVLDGIPNYGKFLKDLVSNKSKMEQISAAFLNEECSAIVQNKLLPKLEFVAVDVKEIPKQEEVEDNLEELPFEEKVRIKTSIQDPATDLEMKPLPKHLKYSYLENDSLLTVFILALLKDDEKKRLVFVLKAQGSGDAKPIIQRQHRLYPNMKEVVKKEIIKLLNAGIIYPIKDSLWVSLVHCVPKKGGMTIVTNEKNKLVQARTVTDWRVFIDYQELRDEDIDDNFPDETLMSVSLNDEEEISLQAYENSKLYKARIKAYHDKKLKIQKEFKAEDKVLLYNSKYGFRSPKLISKWYGPFMIKHDFPSGYGELYDKHDGSFIVNGHHFKYHDGEQLNKLTSEEIHLMCEEGKMKAISFMAPFLAYYHKTIPWVAEKPFIYSVVENTCNKAKLYDLDKTGE
uniref:Reverse transcriptase domain-containing protein n=1 Tax=Tanacetum cinerariifolium TaxID=118510 RepID=A0A6L2KX71_TANCI|nr:reverse transcriptase domain-containing protein [Tanacetum cinerariifolium]